MKIFFLLFMAALPIAALADEEKLLDTSSGSMTVGASELWAPYLDATPSFTISNEVIDGLKEGDFLKVKDGMIVPAPECKK